MVVLRVGIYAHSPCYAKLTAKAADRKSILTVGERNSQTLQITLWAMGNTPRRGCWSQTRVRDVELCIPLECGLRRGAPNLRVPGLALCGLVPESVLATQN